MASTRRIWKKGRGKLGIFDPLLGDWKAEADTPMGRMTCYRSLARICGGAYLQLAARWEFGKGAYQEVAIIGAGADGKVQFWSFTSDGKRSEGTLADASDIHPEAVAFEAKMPAGVARMAYWPDDIAGFHWAVESKTKKGWKRFTTHHYRPV